MSSAKSEQQPMGTPIGNPLRCQQGVIIHGADGSITAYNEAAQNILGLTQAQLESSNNIPWQTIYPDGSVWPLDDYPVMRTLRTGQACQGDAAMGFYRPNGELIWLAIETQPLSHTNNTNNKREPGKSHLEASEEHDVIEGGLEGFSGPVMTTFFEVRSPQSTLPTSPSELETLASQPFSTLETAFQTLLQNTPDLIYFKDTEGRYVTISEAASAWLGIATANIIGKTDRDLFLPEDFEAIQRADAQVMGTGISVTFEEQIVSQGIPKTLMTTKVPWQDSQGQLLGIMGICHDLTELKQAEHKEQQSRLRLRKVLDGLYSFVGLLTPDGILLEANQLALDAANLKSDDVLERPFPDAYWWSYSPEIQAQLWEAIHRAATGETVRYDVPVKVGENQFVTIDFSLVPLLDESGKVEYLVPSGLDITYRQQTEQGLRDRQSIIESQLSEIETIYQTAPIGLAVLDTNLRFVRINQNLAEINGVSVEDHIGRSVREILPALADEAEPQLRHILQTGEPVLNTEINGETPAQPGVQRSWIESFYPFPGQDGQPAGISIVCQEITERRKHDLALKESETRFRLITELLPQIFWTATPNGELDYYSAHWHDYAGVPTAAADKWAWQDCVHPDDVEKMTRLWQLSVDRGCFYQCEHRLRRADGEYRWYLNRAMPDRLESGEIVKWYGTAIDIHEQKQTSEELDRALTRETLARTEAERANRIKDEFLAVLSHELRSPLNPILGWVKLLQMRQMNEEKTTQALRTIERNAKLQTQLIDDLLDIAKILRGKLAFNPEPVSLGSVITSAIETVKVSATAKSLSLTYDIVQPAMVLGDSTRLQQIVWNLLSNAVKFTPNRGQVSIRLEQIDDQATITVRDTGKGIKAEFLPHLFESFRQEDATITRSYGGLGLGLAIVHYLVEMHGGMIMAESLGEDKGAIFTVSLPLMAVEESYQPPPESEIDMDLTGIQVLSVDDDADSREIVTVALEAYGATLTMANGAAAAMSLLETYQPDVLVLDIGLPEVDGYTLLKQIRNLDRHRHTPAIALTAYARDEDRDEALRQGFQVHLTKPIDIIEVVKIVAHLARHNTP